MSVLACGRSDCERIMCSRLIFGNSQYICEDCYTELLTYKETWPNQMKRAEVRQKIEAFMKTPTGTYSDLEDDVDIDAEFNRLTGNEED